MRIGIDMGGTKIEAIALGSGGSTLFRGRVPTPPSYDGTLGAVADLVAGLEREAGGGGTVGVGIPGTISPARGLPDRVQALLPAHVFSDEVATRVVRHAHGDSSGVRGAAWLWSEPGAERASRG